MTYNQPVSHAPDPEQDDSKVPNSRRRAGKGNRGQCNVGKMLDAAREKIEAKRWKDAANMLKRVLGAERNHPVATALLAVVCTYQDKPAEARKLIARAVEAGPMEPEVHRSHGIVLHAFRENDASANAFTRALQLKPDYSDAYRDLALLLFDAGILDQATETLTMAVKLNPRDAVAFYFLGRIKNAQGQDGQALEAYGRAVAIKPDYAEAHVNISKIALDHKKFALGERSCRKAIEADPKLPTGYINMIMVLRALKRPEEAVACGRKAVELDPCNGVALSNLGSSYMDLDRYQEAQACFRKAIQYAPDFADSYYNYGNSLRLTHSLDKARETYDKAIELQSDRAIFYHNRAMVFEEQGRHADALADFRRAVALSLGHREHRFAMALSLWRNGLLEESWDHYDVGLGTDLRKPNRKLRQPRWRGEDISDKRILVWREQGIGDEIDFSRRYSNIISTAGETVIEADKRLLSLFERTFPQARFLPQNLDPKTDWERQDCDLHLPAGNLRQYFPFTQAELDLKLYPDDDIEAAFVCAERSEGVKGHLLPDPERVKEMAARVAVLPDGLKVGICWRSRLSHRDRDIHYTRLQMWEPIFRIPGLVFVNLFYEECEEEITEVERRFGIKIHRWPDIDLKDDMEAAFALTAQMDLVMSTASSPSRIAEAVGKEVWLMSAGASRPQQPPSGDYGIPHQLHWKRQWKEPWSALMERMARALEARLTV
jgi:tetratricopeptide (TPR) repeat protein